MEALQKIIFQKKHAPGVLDMDAGLVAYDQNERGAYKEILLWVQIDYKRRCEIYLLLDDDGEPPYRNILVCGVGRNMEKARNAAIKNLKKEMVKN